MDQHEYKLIVFINKKIDSYNMANNQSPAEATNDKEVQNLIKSFENGENNDDEFTIDPRTGSKTFKLDENGCRKGWKWDNDLGRCVPTQEFLDSLQEKSIADTGKVLQNAPQEEVKKAQGVN